jgi:hypothetical protein
MLEHLSELESVNLKVRENVSPKQWNSQPPHNAQTQMKTST